MSAIHSFFVVENLFDYNTDYPTLVVAAVVVLVADHSLVVAHNLGYRILVVLVVVLVVDRIVGFHSLVVVQNHLVGVELQTLVVYQTPVVAVEATPGKDTLVFAVAARVQSRGGEVVALVHSLVAAVVVLVQSLVAVVTLV